MDKQPKKNQFALETGISILISVWTYKEIF